MRTTCRTRWLLPLLAGLALVARAAEPAWIAEADFSARYAAEVQPHWAARAEPGTVAAADGLPLRYVRLAVPGARAAVVVANGRTESFLKYKELAWDLNRAGYTVYLLDHRGQGLSPRLLPDPAEHDKGHVQDFEDYVRDFAGFVEQVVVPAEAGPRLLLAHSMGGAIAVRLLQTRPGLFRAAALSSPMLEPNARIAISVESSCWWFRHTDWLCPSCYAGFVPHPYQQTPQTLGDYTHSPARWAAVLQEYAQAPAARLGGPTRRWVGEACAVSDRMLAQAGEVRTPLLLLQAGEDTAVMPEAQDAFCSARLAATGQGCGGEQGGPLRIPGAAHELFIEADAYRVPALNAVLDFFARH